MGIVEGLGTALFIVLLVFFVLVALWIVLRVLSSVVRNFEKGITGTKSDQNNKS